MSTAASTALRRCMRSRSTLAACRTNATASRQHCIASSICPGRTLFSSPASTLPQTPTPSPRLHLSARTHRAYSSSVQGTVGKGEAGIPDEAVREVEILTAPKHLNEKEAEIWTLLQKELAPTKLDVQDISGGCGSMYGIEVLSERFRGLSMLKQQRLVNQVLKEEIGGWHGVQLKTGTP